MRVFKNGKSVDPFPPRAEARISLSHASEVSGRVLTAEEATRRVDRVLNVMVATLGVLCVLVVGGLSVFVVFTDDQTLPKIPILGFALAIGVACVFMIRFFIGRGRRAWNERLAERLPLMPAAGDVVRCDAAALVVGEHRFVWSDLTVETLRLTETSDGDGTGPTLVECLELAAAADRMTLDAAMMENGQAIVDCIYGRLRRPRGY